MPQVHREVVLTGPGGLTVREVATLPPARGELLVAPEAVGVCGTDMELHKGTMGYLATGQSSYPLTPGHEWAGSVIAVGDGVEGFAVGDRVVGEVSIGCGGCGRCAVGDYHLCADRSEVGFIKQSGALTQRLAYPARSAHLIPAAVTTQDAALIEPTAVAYRAMLRLLAGAVPGQLAVIGGGTIGLLAGWLRAHSA